MIGFLFGVSPPMAPLTYIGKLVRSSQDVEGDARSMISMLFCTMPELPTPTPTSNFVYPIERSLFINKTYQVK